MLPDSTCSQAVSKSVWRSSSSTSAHSEKFRWLRPLWTSRAINHDPGAMRDQNGHAVSFVWQSKQDRRRIACTSGGASSVYRFGGFLPMSWVGMPKILAGNTCRTAKPTAPAISRMRTRFLVLGVTGSLAYHRRRRAGSPGDVSLRRPDGSMTCGRRRGIGKPAGDFAGEPFGLLDERVVAAAVEDPFGGGGQADDDVVP